MKLKYITTLALIVLFFACDKQQEIDTEKPVISITNVDVFPSYCDTLYFGESFNLKAFFSDNKELGAYSIDVHNNFDHHSHGHKMEECQLGPQKQAVNPFFMLKDYSIPMSLKEYDVNESIAIPSGNDLGLFEEGDYHFQIFLTDKEGWSTPLGLSIKMIHRKD